VSAKKRQTFEKMNRERAVKEKRARKNEKKEQRKLAAQAALNGDVVAEDVVESEETAARRLASS
jgi:hypothetical protein